MKSRKQTRDGSGIEAVPKRKRQQGSPGPEQLAHSEASHIHVRFGDVVPRSWLSCEAAESTKSKEPRRKQLMRDVRAVSGAHSHHRDTFLTDETAGLMENTWLVVPSS